MVVMEASKGPLRFERNIYNLIIGGKFHKSLRLRHNWQYGMIVSGKGSTLKTLWQHDIKRWLPRSLDLDETWWRHQMKTLSALLAICAGNSPVTGEFPRTKASDAEELWCFFICAWINHWVINGEAGDLRRYRVHYDVIVMVKYENLVVK